MAAGRLKAVPTPVSEGRSSPDSRRLRRPPYRLTSILLAVALLSSLGLLTWSRSQLAGRIASLERETLALERKVEGRERIIRAHQDRLGAVRSQVRSLQGLLDEPLPDVP